MPNTPAPTDTTAPTGTRAALLDAGLHFFGQKGFDATSTRELADLADTNIASIAYHFGGKEGLLIACGEEVVRRMQQVIGAPEPVKVTDPEEARAHIDGMVRAFTRFFSGGHGADDMVSFMLREITTGGPALDAVYSTMIEPKHKEMCTLWGIATGQDPESDAVKLAVFAFLGQVLYFRIGREIIGRRMAWDMNLDDHTPEIAEILTKNLHTLLSEGART